MFSTIPIDMPCRSHRGVNELTDTVREDRDGSADRRGENGHATPTGARRLLSPPPEPDRVRLPRVSLTFEDVARCFELIRQHAVHIRLYVHWRSTEGYDAVELASVEELNVANPTDVGSLEIRASYEDQTKLTVTLSFASERPGIEVYGQGEAWVVGKAVKHLHCTLKRTPFWLLYLRSGMLKPGYFTVYVGALLAVTTLSVAVWAVAGHRDDLDQGVAAGWGMWGLLVGWIALLALSHLMDRRLWFQLRPDGTRSRQNWEVIWTAFAAVIGFLGLVVSIITLVVTLR